MIVAADTSAAAAGIVIVEVAVERVVPVDRIVAKVASAAAAAGVASFAAAVAEFALAAAVWIASLAVAEVASVAAAGVASAVAEVAEVAFAAAAWIAYLAAAELVEIAKIVADYMIAVVAAIVDSNNNTATFDCIFGYSEPGHFAHYSAIEIDSSVFEGKQWVGQELLMQSPVAGHSAFV